MEKKSTRTSHYCEELKNSNQPNLKLHGEPPLGRVPVLLQEVLCGLQEGQHLLRAPAAAASAFCRHFVAHRRWQETTTFAVSVDWNQN